MAKIRTCAPVPASYKVQVCAIRRGAPGKQIDGPDDVCRLLQGARAADRESFYTIYLDARNRVIGIDETHKGNLTGVEVHPREIFKGALASNAAAVVVAHNHPSGSPQASADDLNLTRRLAGAGKLVGIPVLDHMIVASDGCASIRESHDGLFGISTRNVRYPLATRKTGVTTLQGRSRRRRRYRR